MKKSFKLNGLACAGCAAKIENKVKKLDGVTSASVSFMTARLVVEGDDGRFDEIAEAAKAIVKKIEPDVVMQSLSD